MNIYIYSVGGRQVTTRRQPTYITAIFPPKSAYHADIQIIKLYIDI